MSDYTYKITRFRNDDNTRSATVSGKNVPEPITIQPDDHNDPDPAITVPVAKNSEEFNSNRITVTLGSLDPVYFFSDGTTLWVTTSDYNDRQEMSLTGTPEPGGNNTLIKISEHNSTSWVVGEIEIDDIEPQW